MCQLQAGLGQTRSPKVMHHYRYLKEHKLLLYHAVVQQGVVLSNLFAFKHWCNVQDHTADHCLVYLPMQFATEAALTILRIDDLIKLDAPEADPEE